MPSTEPKKRIHVAVGVIVNKQREILIALRPDHVHQGGLWEFPGGKVEPGEQVEQALARELREELDISVSGCRPLVEIAHDYPDKQVLLDVWWVDAFEGKPRGSEGQPVRWVAGEFLAEYAFPEANVPILKAVVSELGANETTTQEH